MTEGMDRFRKRRGAAYMVFLEIFLRAGISGLTDVEVAEVFERGYDCPIDLDTVQWMRERFVEDGVLAQIGDRWVWTGGIQ